MPTPRRRWRDYPPQYLNLAKSVATASLPVLYGPYSKNGALTFRQTFNRFRSALRADVSLFETTYQETGVGENPRNTYPARLCEILDTLMVMVRPSPDDPSQYNVIFDTDIVVAEMDKLDPAAAQREHLSRVKFIAANRPIPLSTPMFCDEEMQERIDELNKS